MTYSISFNGFRCVVDPPADFNNDFLGNALLNFLMIFYT